MPHILMFNPFQLGCVGVAMQEFLQKMDSADLVGNILRVDVGQQQLVRDQFNTRKMIMLVTSKGKVRGCGLFVRVTSQ